MPNMGTTPVETITGDFFCRFRIFTYNYMGKLKSNSEYSAFFEQKFLTEKIKKYNINMETIGRG